jgi:chloramphenicol O-acetyltransferase type A
MSMNEAGHYLNLETWPRRAQYAFFRRFEMPFFSICSAVPVGPTRSWCKARRVSFTLASWYACQQAINGIEDLRTRIRGDRVFRYDAIRMASTFLNEDNTFRYVHFEYATPFSDFASKARRAIEAPPPASLDVRPDADDVVHGSVVPYLRFTGITHARPKAIAEDSVPKLVLGQCHDQGGIEMMPVSIAVHHALADGLHIGLFLQALEALFAHPEQTFA